MSVQMWRPRPFMNALGGAFVRLRFMFGVVYYVAVYYGHL